MDETSGVVLRCRLLLTLKKIIMRKVVRSIATVALMFVVATSMAKEPTLSVTSNTEKSLNFEMDAPSIKTVISIIDIDGVIIYTESVNAINDYSKKFDLKNLPEGRYFLNVEDSLRKTIFTLAIDDSTIEIDSRVENSKPVFRKAGDKVFLNLLNLEKGDVQITVYDSDNRVVFKEIITDTMLVEKAFNFETAYDDTYVVVVKNGNDTFYEDIVVK